MRRHDNVVVHPLAFASGRDDSRTAKVGQVPGNLWLSLTENLNEVADANLLVPHQVQKTKPSAISQCLEEAFHVKTALRRHAFQYIRIDRYFKRKYIRLREHIPGGPHEGA